MESRKFSGIVLRRWKKNGEFFVEAETDGGGSFEVRYEPAAWTPIPGAGVDFLITHGAVSGHRVDYQAPRQISAALFSFNNVVQNINEFASKIGGYPKECDVYALSIHKAYRDVCRTIRGLKSCTNKEYILNESRNLIKDRIEHLALMDIATKEEFTEWHQKTCEDLISIFQKNGFPSFSFGQAQKWINMTLKYMYCSRKPLFGYQISFFHIPLDKYMFDMVKSWPDYEKYKFQVLWSKQTDYQAYLAFQQWFAIWCGGCPIDAELILWNAADNKVKQNRSQGKV